MAGSAQANEVRRSQQAEGRKPTPLAEIKAGDIILEEASDGYTREVEVGDASALPTENTYYLLYRPAVELPEGAIGWATITTGETYPGLVKGRTRFAYIKNGKEYELASTMITTFEEASNDTAV